MNQDSHRNVWKKKEPGLNAKENAAEAKSMIERASMEENIQNVIVKFPKFLLARELHNSFTVYLKIPLRTDEVMERIAAAFPGLKIKREEF